MRTTRPRSIGQAAGVPTPEAADAAWPGLTTAQSLAVASQFGVTLAVGVGLGLLAGQWLDGVLHSGIVLTLTGTFVGLVAGISSTVVVYRTTLRTSAREWRDEQHLAAERLAASAPRQDR